MIFGFGGVSAAPARFGQSTSQGLLRLGRARMTRCAISVDQSDRITAHSGNSAPPSTTIVWPVT